MNKYLKIYIYHLLDVIFSQPEDLKNICLFGTFIEKLLVDDAKIDDSHLIVLIQNANIDSYKRLFTVIDNKCNGTFIFLDTVKRIRSTPTSFNTLPLPDALPSVLSNISEIWRLKWIVDSMQPPVTIHISFHSTFDHMFLFDTQNLMMTKHGFECYSYEPCYHMPIETTHKSLLLLNTLMNLQNNQSALMNIKNLHRLAADDGKCFQLMCAQNQVAKEGKEIIRGLKVINKDSQDEEKQLQDLDCCICYSSNQLYPLECSPNHVICAQCVSTIKCKQDGNNWDKCPICRSVLKFKIQTP